MSKYKVGDKVKINTNKQKRQSPWYSVDPEDVFEIAYVYPYYNGVYQLAANINNDLRIVPDAKPQFERVTIQEELLISAD